MAHITRIGSLDAALDAANKDFVASVPIRDRERYQEIFDRDFGIIDYENSQGKTLWDIGTDETAYVIMMHRYPEFEDLS